MNVPGLDRSLVRTAPAALAAWKAAAKTSYEQMLAGTHVIFDARTSSEDARGIATLGEAERQLRADWEWVAGYERGLQDAANVRHQLQCIGPGITDDPKDGWSASGTRRDGYAAGLEDG